MDPAPLRAAWRLAIFIKPRIRREIFGPGLLAMRLRLDRREEGSLPLRVWIPRFIEVVKSDFAIRTEGMPEGSQAHQVFRSTVIESQTRAASH